MPLKRIPAMSGMVHRDLHQGCVEQVVPVGAQTPAGAR
jgi:hypothetical protein